MNVLSGPCSSAGHESSEKKNIGSEKKHNKFGELTWFNKEQDITTETQATTTESSTETSHLITETTTDTTETIFKIICYSEII